jgi:multidrug efflux pump subunit AcrA (membrane-fusion protein)
MTNESNPNTNPAPPAAEHHDGAPEQKATPARFAVTGIVVVLLAGAVVAGLGILSRIHHNDVLAKTTNELAAPTVFALPPTPGAPVDNLLLPGNVTAFTDSPIYARTSGYLLHWYFDIGTKVKKGWR